MRRSAMGAALAAMMALAACVPKAEAPQPEPAPVRPPPAEPARPAPGPVAQDWRDLPLTPGGWAYSPGEAGSSAAFGPRGAQAHFTVRCERSRRQIVLMREGAPQGDRMTIRTSFGARDLPVSAVGPNGGSTTLGASDRLLDSMAFSRGRFTVEGAGQPTLVIPAWPEPARVVEDCRS